MLHSVSWSHGWWTLTTRRNRMTLTTSMNWRHNNPLRHKTRSYHPSPLPTAQIQTWYGHLLQTLLDVNCQTFTAKCDTPWQAQYCDTSWQAQYCDTPWQAQYCDTPWQCNRKYRERDSITPIVTLTANSKHWILHQTRLRWNPLLYQPNNSVTGYFMRYYSMGQRR